MTYEDQAAQIVAEKFAEKDVYGNQEGSFAYFRPWVIKQVAARLKAEDKLSCKSTNRRKVSGTVE